VGGVAAIYEVTWVVSRKGSSRGHVRAKQAPWIRVWARARRIGEQPADVRLSDPASIPIDAVCRARAEHPGETDRFYATRFILGPDWWYEGTPTPQPVRDSPARIGRLFDDAVLEHDDHGSPRYSTVAQIEAAHAELGRAIAEWKLSLVEPAS
jgi:hypothetical protein